MELKTTLSKKNKIEKINYEEANILNDINSIKRPIEIKIKHYVAEFWHEDSNDLKQIGTWNINMLVKDKKTYQVMDCIFAFQFYDLINICINGEYIEGRKKYNISPLIYIGKREYINSVESVIIDIDGAYHPGDSGITYEEYLEYIKEKETNLIHCKTKVSNKQKIYR